MAAKDGVIVVEVLTVSCVRSSAEQSILICAKAVVAFVTLSFISDTLEGCVLTVMENSMMVWFKVSSAPGFESARVMTDERHIRVGNRQYNCSRAQRTSRIAIC